MMKGNKSILLLAGLIALHLSCRLPRLGCDVEMTAGYIESTCELVNGVRFEELQVDSFAANKMPGVYKVVLAFEGRINDVTKSDLSRIYFNRPNGEFTWLTDTTTNGFYRNTGIDRELLDSPAVLTIDSVNEMIVPITKDSFVRKGTKVPYNLDKYESPEYETCPVDFKPATWYYVNFFSPQYAAYLYVDKDMNYQITKINLPTNY